MSDSFNFNGKMDFNNSAVAFGKNASASTVNSAAPMSPEEAELRASLEKLLPVLLTVAGGLAYPAQGVVSGAVSEVTRELAEPRPRWEKIRAALRRVAPAVTALTTLASDVARIADAITPLIPH
jgi:hypothetical protein